MKSMQLTGIRQMEMREEAEPTLERSGDVLLAVGCVGVCGSDVHYYTTGRIGSQVVQYPFPVGHEFAGTVIKTGADVTALRVGDRVAVDPAMWCGTCDQCRAGRFHTCRNLRFLGCPGQAHGCLAQRVVMPAASCCRIADSMTLEQAALAEPLSIGLYAAELASLPDSASVGILGCGPIGLSVLLAVLAQGPFRIYATDTLDVRLDHALRQGARWAGNPDRMDVVREIQEREPLLLDVVFECCGQQDALDQALAILKPGGRLMLVGIPEVDRVSFSIDLLRRKEICIQNVRRQNECVQPTLDMMRQGRISADFMVTHRFPLERAKEAFDLVAEYDDGVLKAMIEVG